jgi:hypothetical protein
VVYLCAWKMPYGRYIGVRVDAYGRYIGVRVDAIWKVYWCACRCYLERIFVCVGDAIWKIYWCACRCHMEDILVCV